MLGHVFFLLQKMRFVDLLYEVVLLVMHEMFLILRVEVMIHGRVLELIDEVMLPAVFQILVQ